MKDYKAIGKGLYKVTFSLCILFLSIITIVITGNYNKNNDTGVDYASNISQTEEIVDDNIIEIMVEDHETTNNDIVSTDNTTYIYDYSPPVDGYLLKSFSYDVPLYSMTMDDWRIHTGIDINSSYGTEIMSIERGIVLDTGYDLNFGNFVEIEHGEVTGIYMSLGSDILVSKGDIVNKGDLIGYLSDSCISEICDEPHLHFEMKINGEYVNPEKYIY